MITHTVYRIPIRSVVVLGYPDALSAARDLPRRAGVVAIPQQALCDHAGVGDQALRWAYCKRPQVLMEALDRLATLGT